MLVGCIQKEHFDIVISNVNVIPIHTDTIYQNTTLGIVGDTIKAIGLSHFTCDTLIDGEKKFVMPGLADMHVHLPDKEETSNFLNLNLAAGVLFLRSMRGSEWHINFRDSILSNGIPAPKLFLSAPPFSRRGNYPNIDSLISSFREQRFDLVKILSVPSESDYYEILDASSRHKLPLAGHTPIVLMDALKSHYGCIEHLHGYNYYLTKDSLSYLAQLTAENKVYNCATIDYYHVFYLQESLEDLRRREGIEFVSESTLKRWDSLYYVNKWKIGSNKETYDVIIQNKYKILAALEDAKSGLILSPDATSFYQIPGFAMYNEMLHYRQAGLSNYRVLEIATRNAAEYMGESERWGTVDINMSANLIMLDENPLEDLANINSVSAIILGGKWIDSKTLKERIQLL